MPTNYIKGAAVGTVSALALAAAGQASAVSFTAGNTDVSVGGYVKGDMIYNVSEDLGDTFANRDINTGAAEDNEIEGQFNAHARQSRLSITTATPAGGSEISTLWQVDFFGNGGNEFVSNSRSVRIRHAFGEWNGIGFGQTWSNFMPLTALPPTLDFGGPTGYVFNRQAQARYTMNAGNGAFSVSPENPQSAILATSNDSDPAPDITARYSGGAGSVSYSASGVLTFLETDDGSSSESATGYAGVLAAKWSAGGTSIGGHAGYYEGANRYHWQGLGGTFNNAVLVNGDIETIGEIGLNLWIDQALTSNTNALLSLGYQSVDDDEEAAAGAAGVAEELMSVHANLRHSPVENVSYGVELQYGTREEFNGDDGDATRIQVSGTYSF